jgi:O-succinylhomoserine sulfhydrylase
VSARALFGSCLYILEDVLTRFGVEVTFVDGTDLAAWKAAVRPDTKAVFLESMSNPTLEVIDLPKVAEIAHAVGAKVVVDNVFSTPVFSRAVELGADVVVYSATKHIDGQGRVLGGVVLGTQDYIRKTLEPYLKHTGGAMSPFSAWLLLKGLETLDLRVNAQADSALSVASALEGHDKLSKCVYPGLASHPHHGTAMAQLDKGGTVIALEVKGGQDAAFRFLNALEIVVISNNLGDAKSIITHPTTTTHQRLTDEQRAALGITPGLVRLSIGLEDADDLIADLSAALEAV